MRTVLKIAAGLAVLSAVPASAATIANISTTFGTLTFDTLSAGDDLTNNSAFSSAALDGYIFDEGSTATAQTFLLHYDRNGGPDTTIEGQFDILLGAGETYIDKYWTAATLLTSDPSNGVLYQTSGSATPYRGLESDDYVITILGSTVNVKYKLVNGTSNALDETRFLIGKTAVPEPASWALMIGGFGLTGAMMRRRRNQSVAVTA